MDDKELDRRIGDDIDRAWAKWKFSNDEHINNIVTAIEHDLVPDVKSMITLIAQSAFMSGGSKGADDMAKLLNARFARKMMMQKGDLDEVVRLKAIVLDLSNKVMGLELEKKMWVRESDDG